MEKVVIYTDGGSRGNPGPAGIGVVITDAKGKAMKEYSNFIGVRTNNEAEYEAVIFGLGKIKALLGKKKIKQTEIEFRLDSQLVARQLNGRYKIEEEKLFPLFIKIWNLKMNFGPVSFTEIAREKNKKADKLANEAMNGNTKSNLKSKNSKLF